MAAFELEVKAVNLWKEFTINQSLKAATKILGKNFDIILWKGSFLNKVAG